MKNAALWQQISDYQIDAPDAEYPFSARLAQENDWSLQFADLVIAEYKRFIYLSCITKQALTPSREVDEAWHLHLTYTKDYWDRFCKGL